jgi:hypothetical protein
LKGFALFVSVVAAKQQLSGCQLDSNVCLGTTLVAAIRCSEAADGFWLLFDFS